MAEEGKDIDGTEAAEAEDQNVAENSSTSYAITKNVFDFEDIGPIDGNVVVVDKIDSLFVCTAVL